jgi:molybdenum cofactor synthesis domain-containing protein
VIPLAEAQAHVRRHLRPLGAVELAVGGASGAVTAAPVVACLSSPPFDNSAVDGFALGAASEGDYRIDGSVAAGDGPGPPIPAGAARRITTGAPVPSGTVAVAMVEDSLVSPDGATVRFGRSLEPGANVRRAAEDVAVGDEVVRAGVELAPAHLGLVAAAGRGSVEVVRRPVVAVCSTGAELVEPGSPVRPGQIPDANRVVLAALVAATGSEVVDLGRTGDDPAEVRERLLDGAARADVVVTSGGVSVGEFDPVRAVLDGTEGARWMQIAIKPAKPFAFGTLGGVPVLGLPGNPVSAVVSFELLVRPALALLGGGVFRTTPEHAATTVEPIPRRPDGKVHYVRVRSVGVDGPSGRPMVVPATAQGSHQLAGLADSDGLAVLPDGDGVDAGATVSVLPLRRAPLLGADDTVGE